MSDVVTIVEQKALAGLRELTVPHQLRALLLRASSGCGYAAMLIPSHRHTPFSTARNCSDVSTPRRFISLTVGTVTMP